MGTAAGLVTTTVRRTPRRPRQRRRPFVPAEHTPPAHSPAVVLTEGPIARTWRRLPPSPCRRGSLRRQFVGPRSHSQRRSRWRLGPLADISCPRLSPQQAWREGRRVCRRGAVAHFGVCESWRRFAPHSPGGPQRTDLYSGPALRRPLQLMLRTAHHDVVLARFRFSQKRQKRSQVNVTRFLNP